MPPRPAGSGSGARGGGMTSFRSSPTSISISPTGAKGRGRPGGTSNRRSEFRDETGREAETGAAAGTGAGRGAARRGSYGRGTWGGRAGAAAGLVGSAEEPFSAPAGGVDLAKPTSPRVTARAGCVADGGAADGGGAGVRGIAGGVAGRGRGRFDAWASWVPSVPNLGRSGRTAVEGGFGASARGVRARPVPAAARGARREPLTGGVTGGAAARVAADALRPTAREA